MFARHIIYGCEYGAGHIYWIDSTQPDAPAVPFTHASLHGFKVIQGPDATDLASRLVQIYRGEVEGIEAHPHYHLGVVKYHRAVCRPYCLEVIRGWLLDTAQHDGQCLLDGIGLAIVIDGECVLDRSDMLACHADALEAAAAADY